MVEQIKWTELSFDFNIPAGKFPALVERLSGTPARLEEKINNMPFLILTQPCNNGWSIQEHAGHLIDLEELITSRLNDFEHNTEVLSPADMSNKKTYDSDYNSGNIKTILKNFRSARSTTIKRLLQYDDKLVLRSAMHPRLKTPMRVIDLVHFFAEHDDHHLAAISRIEKLLS